MKIVCGTDFSQQGHEAVAAAAAIARRCKASLHLVHVLETERDQWGPNDLEKVRATVLTRLADLEREFKPGLEGPITVAAFEGWADQALVGYALEQQASLLVVASTGHRAQPLVVVGGTSERLALSPSVPLLVIRTAEPFTAWAEGKRPLKAMIGLDEGPSCEGACALVRLLRQHGPVDTVAGQVYYSNDARRRYGLRGPANSYDDQDPELEELLTRDLRARLGDLGGEGAVSCRVRRGMGRIADHLLELAESERADVLVCGTTGRRGLARAWSTSQAVLHAGQMAVLAVPPNGEGAPEQARLPAFQRVLAPVDFSALSAAAVPFAYALVPPRSGEVVLVHVISAKAIGPDVAAEYEPLVGKVDASALVGELVARLRALVPADAARRGHVTRTEIVVAADVPRALGELAERLGVDVICMASQGRRGIDRALFGSVADEVMRASRRPVLVVRPPP